MFFKIVNISTVIHLLSNVLTIVSFFLIFFSSFVCSSKWQVSKVTSMTAMFQYATAFNGDLSSWKTTSLTSIYNMFENTKAFNSGKLIIFLFLFNSPEQLVQKQNHILTFSLLFCNSQIFPSFKLLK